MFVALLNDSDVVLLPTCLCWLI